MYAGHYAPAFALKRLVPEAPLWGLFLAVQAVDVLFFVLVPLGVEHMALLPNRGGLALDLTFLPYSHSLVAAFGWAAVTAALFWRRPRVGLALGIAVASHWWMDLPVHGPDLHLGFGDPRVGLGLWHWPWLALGFELALLVACAAWLARRPGGVDPRRLSMLVAALVGVQLVFSLTVPPPSVPLLAVASELGFFLWAGGAWLVEGSVAERGRST